MNPETPSTDAPQHHVPAGRIPEHLHLQAAMRLVPAAPHEREIIARRFLAGIKAAGYSMDSLWGVIDHKSRPAKVRQAALAIPGPGRTAMLFVSHPAPDEDDDKAALRERAASIRAVCAGVSPKQVALCQGLPEPHETWAIEAYEEAGFTHVGDLAYMELRIPTSRERGTESIPAFQGWPAGISVRPLADDLDPGSPAREHLCALLDATYRDTLDCPELCGLRETQDIIDSHKAAGVFDPMRWLIAYEGEKQVGCLLTSLVPETGSAELVYVGLAPEARGRGLGRALLTHAVERLASERVGKFVCAVDRRNTPALRLYGELGMTEFSSRSAWVLPVS